MRISGWSSDVCSSDLEDRNFQNRLAPPPALAVGPYADRPQARPDDWAGIVRPTDSRLGIAGDNEAMAEDEGGLQHQRHPGLEEKADKAAPRSEEHTSELQSLMRTSYAVFCLKKKKKTEHRTKNYGQNN